MNLFDVIRDVRRLRAENGRVSQRMLRMQFQLDDEALDEVVEELVDVQRVAVLDGAVLVHVQTGAAPAVMAADAPVAPAVPLPRDPASSSYTSKNLADKNFLSRSALEGERKQVTVHPQDPRPHQQPSTLRLPRAHSALAPPAHPNTPVTKQRLNGAPTRPQTLPAAP